MTIDFFKKMKHNSIIIRKKWWFIIIPAIVTLAMLLPLKSAKINPDLMEYLPDDIPAKINIDKLDKHFEHYDPVLILFETDDILKSETLERAEKLHQSLINSALVDNVISIFDTKYIRGESGFMLVDPVIRNIPTSIDEREQLRDEIRDNPLVYKTMVSEDFRYLLLLVKPMSGINDSELFLFIQETLAQHTGNEKIFLSGLPILRYEIQRIATRDLAILMPIGLLVMALFLYFSFRERRGVLLPLSVVAMSIVVAMGLMPLLGYELSLIAVLVPIMMIAIANDYGIHIVALYQELTVKNPRWGTKRIINRTIMRLYRPIIFTALTTMVGILGLTTHVMIPAKQMGVVSTVGILFAVVASLLFIPAVMSSTKKSNFQLMLNNHKNGWLGKLLTWAGKITTQKPLRVVVVFSIVIAIATAGILRLQVNINIDELMPQKHKLRQSTAILNEKFGGTKTISVLFEGDVMSPELMHEMEYFEDELEKIPGIGSVTSLATVTKTISRAMNNPGDQYYNRIPDRRDAIAQYIEFYNMSGDPDDFEQLVDFGYTRAVATVQFKAKNYKSFKNIEKSIESMVSESQHATLIAGQSLIEKELSEAIVRGQINSLIFALGAIIVLLWIIFRSLNAGIIGAMPLAVTLLCNFGLMGWLGLELDIATSLLSSIAIGIGVDYTIHLFWRLKQELKLGKSWEEAINTTLKTTGRGITINALSVILGFSLLFFSGLSILKAFAFLIIFSLLLCLLCALILIPAMFILIKPKFLIK